jgi:hypothetical protein
LRVEFLQKLRVVVMKGGLHNRLAAFAVVEIGKHHAHCRAAGARLSDRRCVDQRSRQFAALQNLTFRAFQPPALLQVPAGQ